MEYEVKVTLLRAYGGTPDEAVSIAETLIGEWQAEHGKATIQHAPITLTKVSDEPVRHQWFAVVSLVYAQPKPDTRPRFLKREGA